jgi:hypothetical protein
VTKDEQGIVANLIMRLRSGEFGDFSAPLPTSTRDFLVALISSHISAQEEAVDRSDPISVDVNNEMLAPFRGLVNHLRLRPEEDHQIILLFPDNMADRLAASLDELLIPKGLTRYAVDRVTCKFWEFHEVAIITIDPEDVDQSEWREAYLVLCTGESLPVPALVTCDRDAELVEIVCGLCPGGPSERLQKKIERYCTKEGDLLPVKVEAALQAFMNKEPWLFDDDDDDDQHPKAIKKPNASQVDKKVTQVHHQLQTLQGYVARAADEANKRKIWEQEATVLMTVKRLRSLERDHQNLKGRFKQVTERLQEALGVLAELVKK